MVLSPNADQDIVCPNPVSAEILQKFPHSNHIMCTSFNPASCSWESFV
jgi:hypothetical protein